MAIFNTNEFLRKTFSKTIFGTAALLHFLCWLFGHFALPLSFALGSKYIGLSKDSVSGGFCCWKTL